jgi:hypothetical protein
LKLTSEEEGKAEKKKASTARLKCNFEVFFSLLSLNSQTNEGLAHYSYEQQQAEQWDLRG